MLTLPDHQRGDPFDPWEYLVPQRRRLLERSWAGVFRDYLLQHLPVGAQKMLATAIEAEVGEWIAEREQLQPRLVVLEPVAGELGPLDGVLAFFDPLLGCAAPAVEVDNMIGVFQMLVTMKPTRG